MADAAITPPSEKPAANLSRPIWRQLLAGLLIVVAIGSALLLAVACYFAVVLATDDTPPEGFGRPFVFAYVMIVLFGAAATLILSAGGAFLLNRQPRRTAAGGTAGPIAPLWAWSPIGLGLVVLVILVLVRVSVFGLALAFQFAGNPVFNVLSVVLQWATLILPVGAAILVLILRRRAGQIT